MATQSFLGQVLNEFWRVNMVYPSINYTSWFRLSINYPSINYYLIYILKKNNHKTQKKYYLIKKMMKNQAKLGTRYPLGRYLNIIYSCCSLWCGRKQIKHIIWRLKDTNMETKGYKDMSSPDITS